MKRAAMGSGFIGALVVRGIRNRVVDSSSIEVNRRARRTKTDRLDAIKLVQMLVRVCLGEQDVWKEVRVPAPEVEAARHISRERTALTQETTRLVNQMRSCLATYGAVLPRQRGGRLVGGGAGLGGRGVAGIS
jgi:transposase